MPAPVPSGEQMALANFEDLAHVSLAKLVIESAPSLSTKPVAAALMNMIRLNMALTFTLVFMVDYF